MKKIYLYIFCLICLIPLKVNADTYIDKYYIDMTINDNGDANVKELFIYKGSFNGAYKTLSYNTVINESSHLIDETLYSPTNIELVKIMEIPIDNNVNFNYIYRDGDIFTQNNEATVGSRHCYSITQGYKEYTYKIFNPGKTKGFYIEYNLKNVVVNHNDVNELWQNILRENPDFIKELEMHVNIPSNENKLRAWAHGPLQGDIIIENNNLVIFKIENFNAKESFDVRVVFDNNFETSKKSNINALDNIIDYETNLAIKANEEREKIRLEQQRIEKLKQEQAKFFNILSIIWLVGLFFLIKFIYKNYDKEYISEFKGRYFRDIPNDSNPALVSYLIDKRIGTKELSSTILNLIYKKKISFEEINKKNYKLKLEDRNNLDNLEEDVIELLFEDKEETTLDQFKKRAKSGYDSFLKKYNKWTMDAYKVSSNKNYYEEKTGIKVLSVFYSIIGLLLLIMANKYTNKYLIIATSLLAVFSLLYFIIYTKRTKEGNEEYLKWVGLKNFMNDFGKMDIKELPEIKLWEKYLVYAVTLGCADRLIKLMKLKINDIGDQTFLDSRMLIIANMNSTINSSINNAVSTAKNVAASHNSSGTGSGGGFSSGGFSGGGGGSTGHF